MTAIARTLARALKVNEDLTETIALAHDIGHSPFGHTGERTLNELMSDAGGFDHNLQSLRAVELLELLYPHFLGLNLTWETRAGLRKHEAQKPGAMLDGYPIGPQLFVEGQLADIADDMGYHTHDVDDGLDAGLITPNQLEELAIWKLAVERAQRKAGGPLPEYCYRSAVVRSLLDLQVEDVIRESHKRLQHKHHYEEVMQASERCVCFSDKLLPKIEELRDFLAQNLYFHPQVAAANEQASQMTAELFLFYCAHPETMGRKAQARLEQHGLKRTACDYLAGMTDRYACAEYERLVKKI